MDDVVELPNRKLPAVPGKGMFLPENRPGLGKKRLTDVEEAQNKGQGGGVAVTAETPYSFTKGRVDQTAKRLEIAEESLKKAVEEGNRNSVQRLKQKVEDLKTSVEYRKGLLQSSGGILERRSNLEEEAKIYGPAAREFPGKSMTEKLGDLKHMEPLRQVRLIKAVQLNVSANLGGKDLGFTPQQVEESYKALIKGNDRKFVDFVGMVQEQVFDNEPMNMAQAIRGLELLTVAKAMRNQGRGSEFASWGSNDDPKYAGITEAVALISGQESKFDKAANLATYIADVDRDVGGGRTGKRMGFIDRQLEKAKRFLVRRDERITQTQIEQRYGGQKQTEYVEQAETEDKRKGELGRILDEKLEGAGSVRSALRKIFTV